MITKEGFSIHTFELTRELDYEVYRRIKARVYELSGGNKGVKAYNKDNVFYTGCLFENGIAIFLYSYEGYRPFISIKVNLRYINGMDDAAAIYEYSEESYDNDIKSLNELLTDIDAELAFEKMTLHRVDLCVNVGLKNVMETAELMRLINKTYLPGKYMREVFSGSDSAEKNKHSFRAGNGNVTITVYDKIFQIKERGYDRFCKDFDSSAGLLRFEVSLQRRKLLKLASGFGRLINNYDFLKYLCSNSKELMKPYIYKLFPRGVYCSYGTAVNLIKQSCYGEKIKEKLLFLLIKTSECKNMNKAMLLTQQHFALSKKQQCKLLECFDEMGINPVTLKNNAGCLIRAGVRDILDYDEHYNKFIEHLAV